MFILVVLNLYKGQIQGSWGPNAAEKFAEDVTGD